MVRGRAVHDLTGRAGLPRGGEVALDAAALGVSMGRSADY
jgi:hypothetical protein